MITIRKLASLPTVTALRKSARLLQGFELELRSGKSPDPIYLKDLISFIRESSAFSTEDRIGINTIITESGNSLEIKLRTCNRLRHLLLSHLNEEPADWDLLQPDEGRSDKNEFEKRHILPLEVYLDDIRSPFNVGSIFRSSESFGISKILITTGTASPTHRRALRTSMGCTDIIPWEEGNCQNLLSRNIFALELNGKPVDQFNFPSSGVVIIGSEELGVSPECLRIADNSFGRVSIPLAGTKGSINVSVAFGILMYHWYSQVVKP